MMIIMRSSFAIMFDGGMDGVVDSKSDLHENGFLQSRHSVIEGQAHPSSSTERRQTGSPIPPRQCGVQPAIRTCSGNNWTVASHVALVAQDSRPYPISVPCLQYSRVFRAEGLTLYGVWAARHGHLGSLPCLLSSSSSHQYETILSLSIESKC